MTAPSVAGIVESGTASYVTTASVTLPSSIAAGDLILIALSVRRDQSITDPLGYDRQATLLGGDSTNTYCRTVVVSRVATGGETAATFTLASSSPWAARALRITGASSSAPIHKQSTASNSSSNITNLDAPSLTPTLDETLGVTLCGNYYNKTSAHTGYATIAHSSYSVSDRCHVASAYGAGPAANNPSDAKNWSSSPIAHKPWCIWHGLIAPAASTIAATGALPLGLAIAGTANADIDATGALPLGLAIAGTANANIDATGALPLGLAIAGTAEVVGSSEATGLLPIGLSVSGYAEVDIDLGGTLPIELSVSGYAEADIVTSGALSLGLAIAGQASLPAIDASGTLAVALGLSGTIEPAPPLIAPLLAETTDEAWLCLLVISSPGLAEPLRLTSDGIATIHLGDTYQPWPFAVTLLDDGPDKMPAAAVRIDNADTAILATLRSLSTRPTVDLIVVRASSPDVVEVAQRGMEVIGETYTEGQIDLSLAGDDLSREPYPPALFDGRYRGLVAI